MSETQAAPDGPQTGVQSLDAAIRPAWSAGDPLMEAIAVAVWEQCRTEGTSTVVDDPRTIAAVAATVARRLGTDRGDAAPAPIRRVPRLAGPTPACLFCQLDDPAANRIMLENATCFARYDNYPAAPGHVEIVPRRHVESYFDLTAAEVADAHALLHAARHIIDAEHHPDGYTIGINDGRAAGRTVDHVHIHLIPRHHGDVPDPRGGIRRGLPNGDPDQWATGPVCSGTDGFCDVHGYDRHPTAPGPDEARPRCPDCQMPHDLTPGSLPMATCSWIRARIAEDPDAGHWFDGEEQACARCGTSRSEWRAAGMTYCRVALDIAEDPAPAPDGLRDRYAAAIREWHGDWTKDTFAEAADAVIAVRDEELLRLRTEAATADQIRAEVQQERDRLLTLLGDAVGWIHEGELRDRISAALNAHEPPPEPTAR